jgi:hypothetical protein
MCPSEHFSWVSALNEEIRWYAVHLTHQYKMKDRNSISGRSRCVYFRHRIQESFSVPPGSYSVGNGDIFCWGNGGRIMKLMDYSTPTNIEIKNAWKFMFMPRVILGAKFWDYVGANAEPLCVKFCNFVQWTFEKSSTCNYYILCNYFAIGLITA